MRAFAFAVVALACASSAARAVDLPLRAVVPAPSVYNWTGIYVGAHGGYGVGMKDWSNGDPFFLNAPFDAETKGFLGGGQIGVNQQIGNLLIGIELDASWANLKGSQTIVDVSFPVIGIPVTNVGSSTIDRLATVAGRIGVAQDRWLVYFKGGGAWLHEEHAYSALSISPIFGAPPVVDTAAATGSETRFGPMLGFGTEYALWGNLSFKSEYNYFSLPNGGTRLVGTRTFAGPFNFNLTMPLTPDVRIQQAFHVVKFGLNYRFGPEAPLAIALTAPARGYNWTGFYAGVQAGYGFGRKAWEGWGPGAEFDVSGALAGGVTGTNVQAGAFVFGAESEWMWSAVKGSTQFPHNFSTAAFDVTQTSGFSSRIDWISLNSLRAGFVAADRWLVYVKGGIALARETHGLTSTQQIPAFNSGQAVNLSGSALHTGYLAGLGVEHAFLGNWSARLEYNYVHFRPQSFTEVGSQTFDLQGLGAGANAFAARVSALQQMHLVKLGVNYHFSALPDVVSAKF